MTVNALKIIKQAGSKLILTGPMLEEVHSHIWASDREYTNDWREVDKLVDEALAAESPKILIRAYYYAKLDVANPNRPKTWSQYLNNFLTPARLTSALSPATLKELREVLCTRFGLEFELREKSDGSVRKSELNALARQIQAMRSPDKRPILAENDAFMILRIDGVRKKKESTSANPFGFKTWYLTQDVISNIASSICFPLRRGVRYVMRPEFLINYIAYNPTDETVRDSLKTIFPSILGVRLGARLEPDILKRVLESIRKAHEVDPARAVSIISEHADSLKADRLRDFALKYTPSR